METNKAPNKIVIGKHNIRDNGDVVFAWITNSPECEPMKFPIEYIRTDAFFKKARKWFQKSEHFDFNGIRRYGKDDFEDFEKYMKNE